MLTLNDKFKYICEAFTTDTVHDVSVLFAFDEAWTMINIEGEHEASPVFTGAQHGLRSLPLGL